jgi:hypothetical protein
MPARPSDKDKKRMTTLGGFIVQADDTEGGICIFTNGVQLKNV